MASDRTAGAANEASGLAAIFRRACRVMDGSMVDTDEREDSTYTLNIFITSRTQHGWSFAKIFYRSLPLTL